MLPGPCRKISLLAVSLLFPFGYTSSFSSLRFLPFFPVHLFASLSWVLHMQLRNFVHFRFTCNTGIGKIRFRKYLSSRMSHGPLVSLCVSRTGIFSWLSHIWVFVSILFGVFFNSLSLKLTLVNLFFDSERYRIWAQLSTIHSIRQLVQSGMEDKAKERLREWTRWRNLFDKLRSRQTINK